LSLQDIGLIHLYDQYKGYGTDLDAILANCGDEIDERISEYINNESSADRFKRNRLVFKMNIPKLDLEFWED
jgi:hypothetical protein